MSTSRTIDRHQHADCPACRDENYERAKADRVASVVLDAMHQQDAVTYNGASSDMGRVALDAAAKIRDALADGSDAAGRTRTATTAHGEQR